MRVVFHGNDGVVRIRKKVEVPGNGCGKLDMHVAGASHAWGFGERFDAFDQTGLCRKTVVFEKFTHQGENAYFPVPLAVFETACVYVDSPRVSTFMTYPEDGGMSVEVECDSDCAVHVICHEPREALRVFLKLTEKPSLPPSWVFGIWMSANRWRGEKAALGEVAIAKENGIQPSVVVLEAWSDEMTFYLEDKEHIPNLKGLVEALAEEGVRLILWQIPVFKSPDDGQTGAELERDRREAVDLSLCLKRSDGSAYEIPRERWFGGSYIPDFTNPAACRWWFGKRRSLLDAGVAGFKTDGGEFVYDDDVVSYNGLTGRELKNLYPYLYEKAYKEAVGKDRVLFSRAGFTGANAYSLHWAGDQMSQWSELRAVLNAGLNAALSGIFFWGFDIAGFAGSMPSAELYLRAFALAVFSPIMQWHSEPIGGQFKDIQASDDAFNDRSPWNVARHTGDKRVMEHCRRLCQARIRLMGYLAAEAGRSVESGEPLLKPLMLLYPHDAKACRIDDEYLFGNDLLVCPILEESVCHRSVYLPEGSWVGADSVERKGPVFFEMDIPVGSIGLFVRSGAQMRSVLLEIAGLVE